MKKTKFLLVISFVLILVCGLILSPSLVYASDGSTGNRDSWIGAWESIDLVDGSNQRLTVSGGQHITYKITYYDDSGSMCGGDPFIGIGEGTIIEENLVEVEMLFRCLSRPVQIKGPYIFSLEYDVSTDTLLQWEDGCGPYAIWHRIGE